MSEEEAWTVERYKAFLRATQTQIASSPCLPIVVPEPARDTPESALLAQIRRLAKDMGYLCYHTYRSMRSEPGFPDVVLARCSTPWCTARLVFAELKSRKGRVSKTQNVWLETLREIASIEVYVWTPKDIETIATILAA